ncbi:hypothetical protein [Enterococcus sp. 5H]|uniref:hypothetical protein n=1 Tax=Enterococcus sp. 5H TaxID=1229490 RepID=UPI0023037B95|nr:hypothetical protein [Enterococcus sp. 5H]MDA9470058.1 hypothetical protein [Enterococcus sp. 5H]
MTKITMSISIITLVVTICNTGYTVYDKRKHRSIQTSYSENRKQFEELIQIIADTATMIRLYPRSKNKLEQLGYEAKLLSKKPLFYSNLDYNNKFAEELRSQFNLMITILLDGTVVDAEVSYKELIKSDPEGFKALTKQDQYILILYKILDDYTSEYRRINKRLV